MNQYLFLASVFLLLGFLLLLIIFRTVAKIMREKERTVEGAGSEVGFVVDTFHGLVAKLKEKERELEILRKQAEERADVIEHHNEYILQSVPSGVISLDSSLRITKVNSAAEKILEIRAEEVIGRHSTDIFREPLKAILEGRHAIGREEFQYTTVSGKHVHIGFTLTPLRDMQRVTIGQLMVFTDLTELKALESQAELRDRLSSLGEMAAGMAHELRNPMGVIAGYAKMLARRIDPAMGHIVDSIMNEIAVMDRIIGDFLSFARPTELTVTTVDLSQLIENCLSHPRTAREDIVVYSEIDGIPAIQGDEILLRQAFTNLVQNAFEAMPMGGTLRVAFSVDDAGVEVAVSDTGHGIPETIREKIFLPFYTTKDRGTGLGLAIVHKIIVSHQGSVAVESGEGCTTFRVRIPLRP